jgi:hypothetical protein
MGDSSGEPGNGVKPHPETSGCGLRKETQEKCSHALVELIRMRNITAGINSYIFV